MSTNIQSGGVFMEQQGTSDLLLVDGYGDGGFRLRGDRVEGSVLILGNDHISVSASSVN